MVQLVPVTRPFAGRESMNESAGPRRLLTVYASLAYLYGPIGADSGFVSQLTKHAHSCMLDRMRNALAQLMHVLQYCLRHHLLYPSLRRLPCGSDLLPGVIKQRSTGTWFPATMDRPY